jgi:hypothetical protein
MKSVAKRFIVLIFVILVFALGLFGCVKDDDGGNPQQSTPPVNNTDDYDNQDNAFDDFWNPNQNQ